DWHCVALVQGYPWGCGGMAHRPFLHKALTQSASVAHMEPLALPITQVEVGGVPSTLHAPPPAQASPMWRGVHFPAHGWPRLQVGHWRFSPWRGRRPPGGRGGLCPGPPELPTPPFARPAPLGEPAPTETAFTVTLAPLVLAPPVLLVTLGWPVPPPAPV